MNTNPLCNDIEGCIKFYLHSLLVKDFSQHTIALKQRHLTQFNEWLDSVGICNLMSVNIDVFENYMAHVRQLRVRATKQLLAASTIRCRLTTVRVFLRFLTKRGIISNREVDKYELPSLGLPLPKPILSYDDVLRVLKHIPLTTVKGIRDRYVPFGKTAAKWLMKYLRDARPSLSNLQSGNAFFLNSLGTRFRPCLLSELMSKYIRKANINKTGACHQYRHAAATHMVDNDADIRHVQEFLGHASISTTQLYLHVSKAKLRSVYAKTHPRAD